MMSLLVIKIVFDKHRCDFVTSESALQTSGRARISRILPQTVIIYVRRLVTSHNPILILIPGFAPSKLIPVGLKHMHTFNQQFINRLN